jgi:hypothetical protein
MSESRLKPEILAAIEGWQPIETAPRDGTAVLLCGGLDLELHKIDVVLGFYTLLPEDYGDAWDCQDGFGNQFLADPLYWQPKPTPPSKES